MITEKTTCDICGKEIEKVTFRLLTRKYTLFRIFDDFTSISENHFCSKECLKQFVERLT